MSFELLYTSAQAGLRQGTRGFCTVLSTAGLPVNLANRLESLSGYRHVYQPQSERADQNPTNWSHIKLKASGRSVSVLSRVSSYGVDYTGRTNKLAHHVVVEPDEKVAAGPASLLKNSQLMCRDWDGETAIPQQGPRIPDVPPPSPAICKAWQQATGDAGWAGVLADAWMQSRSKPVWVVFDVAQGGVVLDLLCESIALLPEEHRWNATFSTYYTKLPPEAECKVRFVLSGSEEARMAPASGRVVNLSAPGNIGQQNEWIRFARHAASQPVIKEIDAEVPSQREAAFVEDATLPWESPDLLSDDSLPNLLPPSVRAKEGSARATHYKTPRAPGSSTPPTISTEQFDNARWLWGALAICLLILVAGGAFMLVKRPLKAIAQNRVEIEEPSETTAVDPMIQQAKKKKDKKKKDDLFISLRLLEDKWSELAGKEYLEVPAVSEDSQVELSSILKEIDVAGEELEKLKIQFPDKAPQLAEMKATVLKKITKLESWPVQEVVKELKEQRKKLEVQTYIRALRKEISELKLNFETAKISAPKLRADVDSLKHKVERASSGMEQNSVDFEQRINTLDQEISKCEKAKKDIGNLADRFDKISKKQIAWPKLIKAEEAKQIAAKEAEELLARTMELTVTVGAAGGFGIHGEKRIAIKELGDANSYKWSLFDEKSSHLAKPSPRSELKSKAMSIPEQRFLRFATETSPDGALVFFYELDLSKQSDQIDKLNEFEKTCNHLSKELHQATLKAKNLENWKRSKLDQLQGAKLPDAVQELKDSMVTLLNGLPGAHSLSGDQLSRDEFLEKLKRDGKNAEDLIELIDEFEKNKEELPKAKRLELPNLRVHAIALRDNVKRAIDMSSKLNDGIELKLGQIELLGPTPQNIYITRKISETVVSPLLRVSKYTKAIP
ncbi:hypothetical protein SV7mr_18980 [Stieleria bergensis]|uniref:Uncharacterized protein n=1 Tax=Stieleria bergensis TaxID=2528025 RepID=A0A517STD6_9BACT|nr:hypothetical protein SV7mr_18980 [Planctomycetes bacterium SV_7m_r]